MQMQKLNGQQNLLKGSLGEWWGWDDNSKSHKMEGKGNGFPNQRLRWLHLSHPTMEMVTIQWEGDRQW